MNILTIGNTFAVYAVIALTAILITETFFFVITAVICFKRAKQRTFFIQKVLYSLALTQKLRQLISEKSRKSVLQVTEALGELELVEESINDKVFSSSNETANNENTEIVAAIDNALCKCLESLQFEDYTNQIREHIQILENDAASDWVHTSVSEKVQKSVTDRCRQIFSIDEEFAVLNYSTEDIRK